MEFFFFDTAVNRSSVMGSTATTHLCAFAAHAFSVFHSPNVHCAAPEAPTQNTPKKRRSPATTIPVSTPKTPETVLEVAWGALVGSVKKVGTPPTGLPLEVHNLCRHRTLLSLLSGCRCRQIG